MGCWSIWKFAQNKAAAQQFLVDLCIAGKEATIQSQLYNFPTFDKAMPFPEIRKFAAADTHKPKGKYTILTTIAREVHAQHRLSRHDERGDRRDLPEVPDPADVRAGVAGQAERRGLGAPHEHRDQEHLRQVAEARDALIVPAARAPASSRGRPAGPAVRTRLRRVAEASQARGVNGRSSSSPGRTIPTCDSGTSFQAPGRSPSGSETTTLVSSDSAASTSLSG